MLGSPRVNHGSNDGEKKRKAKSVSVRDAGRFILVVKGGLASHKGPQVDRKAGEQIPPSKVGRQDRPSRPRLPPPPGCGSCTPKGPGGRGREAELIPAAKSRPEGEEPDWLFNGSLIPAPVLVTLCHDMQSRGRVSGVDTHACTQLYPESKKPALLFLC